MSNRLWVLPPLNVADWIPGFRRTGSKALHTKMATDDDGEASHFSTATPFQSTYVVQETGFSALVT